MKASGLVIRRHREPFATALRLAKAQLRGSTRSKFLYCQIRKYFDLATRERGWRSRKETVDMTAATFGVSPRTVETALAETKDVP